MKRFVSMLLAVLLIAAVPSVAFAKTDDAAEKRRYYEDFIAKAEQALREEMEAAGYTEIKTTAAEVLKKAKIDPKVSALAYSDLENASPAQKEKILAARRKIIFQVDSWYDDMGGVYSAKIDPKSKTWKSSPRFSELFPGWDVPTEEATEPVKTSQEELKATLEKDLAEQGYTKVAPITKQSSLASIDVAPKTRALAYADFEKATPAQQEKILAARNEVIFSAEGWYDDQGGVYAVNVNEESKTYQEVPKFSELFPDWDVPTEPDVDIGETAIPTSSDTFTTRFNGTVSVPKYEEGVISGYFYTTGTIRGVTGEFYETVLSLQNCTTINLGLTDLSGPTPKSLAWHKNARAGERYHYTVNGNTVTWCGFRTGVYNISNASARIRLDGKNVPLG